MLLRTTKLLGACSIALSVMAAPAFAGGSPGDPFKGPQVFAAPADGRDARAQALRAGKSPAPRGKITRVAATETEDPGSPRSVFSAFGGASASSVVAEARRYIGTNPTNRRSLWCAAFMNLVLKRAGFRDSGSNLAKSFASYGKRVSGPKVGAIAVMSRGKSGGHVGVVSGLDPKGNPIVISGNHNDRVAESVYPRSRIIAYVMPEA
ncbi:MAG: TIGR02594 family protein [Xanthobacteraceae bacterium]